MRAQIIPRLIVGSGRSGTTWVLDCLSQANELRPIFEPLHPAESSLGLRYAYQAMAEADEDEELERHFRNLAAGRIRSRWIDYRGSRQLLFPHVSKLDSMSSIKRWARRWWKYIHDRGSLRRATRRENTLIKCIRANLMAGWLTRTIGFRTVMIVRHPCAVLESQVRLGTAKAWDPTPVLARYRASRKLHEVTGGRYERLLESNLTRTESLALRWVIENQLPVERSREDGYSVVCYEDLVLRPEVAWPSVCASLELEHVPDRALLGRPSQQASPSSASIQTWREPGWKSRLTTEQLHAIQGVLDATGCSFYSIRGIEPSIDVYDGPGSASRRIATPTHGVPQSGP
jgi:hypothetical protein